MDKYQDTNQNAIDEIMDNFHFDKVGKVMLALDWHWWDAEHGVPSVPEIRKTARRLLKEALDRKTNIATGGFRASYQDIPSENGEPGCERLMLEFIVDDWFSDVVTDSRES
jgi:hypothetical protein